jgi:hypothetical protein
MEVFLDGAPTHAQVAFDLADGPALRVEKLMQGLDLFVGQHRPLLLFSGQIRRQTREMLFARRFRGGRFAHGALQDKDLRRSQVVVCKIHGSRA